MALMQFAIFSGAMAFALWAIMATVVPQWERIGGVLLDSDSRRARPFAALASAERRIVVRHAIAPRFTSRREREAA